MHHLLVTNDFPPKVGGIQSYLWELWRRLPADEVTVLTTPHPEATAFDSEQAFRVVRTRQKWLLPTRSLTRQIDALAHEVEADFVVLDPALPLGYLGSSLSLPYVVIGHGAEFVIPQRIVGVNNFIGRVAKQATGLIASGDYVKRSMEKASKQVEQQSVVSVPPGVDVRRFHPLDEQRRVDVRRRWGVSEGAILVVGVSRLVPRKGFDRLVRAAALMKDLDPKIEVLIGGKGREHRRLERLVARTGAPVRLLGRVDSAELPALYGAADVFAMPCHDRWFGFEQEGFGIVFVEAAAAGVATVAGASGGSIDAVAHEESAIVVAGRAHEADISIALARLARDPELRKRLAQRGRQRAEAEFSYDVLAERLNAFLAHVGDTLAR